MATVSASSEPSSNAIDHCELVTQTRHNKTYACNYCKKVFEGSATRCYVHLTGDGKGISKCPNVPKAVVTALVAAASKRQAD